MSAKIVNSDHYCHQVFGDCLCKNKKNGPIPYSIIQSWITSNKNKDEIVAALNKYGFTHGSYNDYTCDNTIIHHANIFEACLVNCRDGSPKFYFWRYALFNSRNQCDILLKAVSKSTESKHIVVLWIAILNNMTMFYTPYRLIDKVAAIQSEFLTKFQKNVITALKPVLIDDLIPQILKYAHPFQIADVVESSNFENAKMVTELDYETKVSQRYVLDIRNFAFDTTHAPKPKRYFYPEFGCCMSLKQDPFDCPPPLEIDWTGILYSDIDLEVARTTASLQKSKKSKTNFPSILSLKDVINHKHWLHDNFTFVHLKHAEYEVVIEDDSIYAFEDEIKIGEEDGAVFLNNRHAKCLKRLANSFEEFIFRCFLIHCISRNRMSHLKVVQDYQKWQNEAKNSVAVDLQY
jgi:hypothetical protein